MREEGRTKGDCYPQGRGESAWSRDEGGEGAVYGALGQAEEEPTYELPKDWNTLVSTLCLRTNFEPAELADLYQRFRQLAGVGFYIEQEGMYRTESEWRRSNGLTWFLVGESSRVKVIQNLNIFHSFENLNVWLYWCQVDGFKLEAPNLVGI